MRKIFFILYLLISSILYSEQSFIINTSKGPQKVVIPEGMTAVDAFKEMAVLYLNERFDHEKTLEEVDKLVKEAKEYIAQVKDYKEKQEKLQKKYDDLVLAYDSENKLFAPLFLIGVQSDFIDSSKSLKLSSGLLFKDFLIGTIDISYPLGIGFSIGGIF